MSGPPKRGPTVLVTDAREQRPRSQGQSRPADLVRRPTSRLITVDNVLQYATDVPSMQQRGPPQRPQAARTRSSRPSQPRLAGRPMPSNMPARSTKVSEKLVLLPDTENALLDDLEEKADYAEDNEAAPERDDERERRRAGRKGKSYAERLPKSRRADKLARCTAYCTAQAYNLGAMATFLRDQHGAKTKLYDDCLYAVFHLPLLPGTNGYRIRSSPVIKSPGGKAVLDEEIERHEQRDYAEGYFEEDEQAETFSVRGEDGHDEASPSEMANGRRRPSSPATPRQQDPEEHRPMSPSRPGGPDARSFAELFIFSYGVAVFWNFTSHQEKDVLADLTFFAPVTSPTLAAKEMIAPPDSPTPFSPFSQPPSPPPATAATAAAMLVINGLPDSEYETEEFHFEYMATAPRPRVFNDMITLRSGDHMVKLTISHAIAQSTKLSLFEQRMGAQMAAASPIPRRLALTGTLGLTRREVLRIMGALYRTRVEVNLSEPVLDTPQFFWQSEPPLYPLYAAIRAYLEITPRVKVLNERCRVFLDLAEMLSEGVADATMSSQTWIIIVLIGVSIAVTCSEVFLRFGLLAKGAQSDKLAANATNPASLRPNATDQIQAPLHGIIQDGRCLCPVVTMGPNSHGGRYLESESVVGGVADAVVDDWGIEL